MYCAVSLAPAQPSRFISMYKEISSLHTGTLLANLKGELRGRKSVTQKLGLCLLCQTSQNQGVCKSKPKKK